MIIGICGKSGSGKSTLANKIIELTKKSVVHLNIDKIGHDVLLIDTVKEELVKSFGSTIIDKDIIDRKKLSKIVFESKIEMEKLTDITWDYMQIEIDKFLNDNKDKIIILDWILLPITKYFKTCNLKILLDIPYEVRKSRAIKRDNISESAFDLREKASINYNHESFDYVLNSIDINVVKKVVELL